MDLAMKLSFVKYFGILSRFLVNGLDEDPLSISL